MPNSKADTCAASWSSRSRRIVALLSDTQHWWSYGGGLAWARADQPGHYDAGKPRRQRVVLNQH